MALLSPSGAVTELTSLRQRRPAGVTVTGFSDKSASPGRGSLAGSDMALGPPGHGVAASETFKLAADSDSGARVSFNDTITIPA